MRIKALKHELLVNRILTEMYEPWMDDNDKAEFAAEVILLFGEQLDADIETGIANGFTESQQENIARSLLRAMNK